VTSDSIITKDFAKQVSIAIGRTIKVRELGAIARYFSESLARCCVDNQEGVCFRDNGLFVASKFLTPYMREKKEFCREMYADRFTDADIEAIKKNFEWKIPADRLDGFLRAKIKDDFYTKQLFYINRASCVRQKSVSMYKMTGRSRVIENVILKEPIEKFKAWTPAEYAREVDDFSKDIDKKTRAKQLRDSKKIQRDALREYRKRKKEGNVGV
jgi:hypothetical protein